MGREFPWLCHFESRRFLWLMGLTFASIVTFQYLELPYGISSLFSSSKIPASSQTDPSSSRSADNSNGTHSGDNLGPVRVVESYNGYNETEKAGDSGIGNTTLAMAPSFQQKNDTSGNESRSTDDELGEEEEEVDQILDKNGESNSSSWAMPPDSSKSPAAFTGLNPYPGKENASAPASMSSPEVINGLNPPQGRENASAPSIREDGKDKRNLTRPYTDASPVKFVPDFTENTELPVSGVISISEMSERLCKNRASHPSKRPKWPSEPDRELLRSKIEIENAPIDEKDPLLYAPLYRNVSMFKRSYELMEKMLKVYVYKEGQRPIMHTPVLKGIYASEGWFMKLLESNRNFVTKDARKAHLFYLPFSSRMLEETLYVKDSHSHRNLVQFLKEYIDFIAGKYSFWNRTSGSDHFLVACHDWAPTETRKYMANCIRAMCNSDVKEGFVFGKDASLPETFVRDLRKPLKDLGGKPASRRPTLAFFAGKPDHGYLRAILLSYWGDNKDPDMKIFGKLPRSKGNKNYIQLMKTSKYCICAKGYEVNSPRVVESIFYECVPVIISDNFVPPFFEVLNWESFAVFVLEKDIPNLKKILTSIPEKRYRQMQMRVKKVQKHFLWHSKPENATPVRHRQPLPGKQVSSSENTNGGVGGNPSTKATDPPRPLVLDRNSKPDSGMKTLNQFDHKSYVRFMNRSRFCVCAKGYELNSPHGQRIFKLPSAGEI